MKDDLVGPELAIVTRTPDDPIMTSLVSQFLETEVFFEFGENQDLLAQMPDDPTSYRAIAFDPTNPFAIGRSRSSSAFSKRRSSKSTMPRFASAHA